MVMNSIFRYFVLPESQISGHKADLIPDNDLLPLSNLKVIKYPYPVADGRYIVKAEIPLYMIKSLKEQCEGYEIIDPISKKGVITLQFINSYVGETREDVLKKFPELNGYIGETEELKFPKKDWSTEKYK